MATSILEQVFQKFKDKVFLLTLKKELQNYSQKIYVTAQAHDNFCNKFPLNPNIQKAIYKITGISEQQLKSEMAKLNMVKNSMYTDPGYQAFLLVYLIGVKFDDKELRKLALFFILTRLYNGINSKYFTHGCQENIMRHVQNYKLTNKHIVKSKGPLETIAYFIDTLDEKYYPEIKKDPVNKLQRLFAQAWGRLNQMIRILAQKYYESHRNQETSGSISALQTDEQGYLKIDEQAMDNAISMLIDKFEKAKLIKPLRIPESEKHYLAQKMTVTKQAIDKIVEWINSPDNNDKVNLILSFLLKYLKVQHESDVAKFPTLYTAEKIASKKDKLDARVLKENIDEAIKEIFGELVYSRISVTQKLKLRKLFLATLFFLFKSIITKDNTFEKIDI